MLRLVLGPYGVSSSEDLSFDVFETLVAERVQEFQHLDYKSILPADHPEFAYDVAAMANGGGGLLVFGVADNKSDEAVDITSVPLAGSAARLRNIAMSRVVPHLSYRIIEASDPKDPNHGVLVFEVPQSYMKPFAAVEQDRFQYKIRSGREKRDMTEADIERLYRERFRFTEQLEARLAGLADRAAGAPGTITSLPRAYVVALPFEQSRERVFAITNETTVKARSLSSRHLLGAGTGYNARQDFRYYRITADGRPNLLRTELHDNGGYLGTINGDLRKDEDGTEQLVSGHSVSSGTSLIDSLSSAPSPKPSPWSEMLRSRAALRCPLVRSSLCEIHTPRRALALRAQSQLEHRPMQRTSYLDPHS